MEKTLIILKPDTLHRGLVGQILSRFEGKALTISAMKLTRITEDLARKHYADHCDRPFFPDLLTYITSGPVVVAVISGPKAISVVRKLMGATFGYDAEPGTIRGDLCNSQSNNLVHGSDSPGAAAKEIALYFSPEEIHQWQANYTTRAYTEDEQG